MGQISKTFYFLLPVQVFIGDRAGKHIGNAAEIIGMCIRSHCFADGIPGIHVDKDLKGFVGILAALHRIYGRNDLLMHDFILITDLIVPAEGDKVKIRTDGIAAQHARRRKIEQRDVVVRLVHDNAEISRAVIGNDLGIDTDGRQILLDDRSAVVVLLGTVGDDFQGLAGQAGFILYNPNRRNRGC